MDIVNLIAKFNFSALTKGEKAMADLGSTTKKTEKELNAVDETLSGFGELGGPVGEVAGEMEKLKDKTTAALGSIRSLAAGLGSVAATSTVVTAAIVALAGGAGILAALRFTATLDELSKLGQELGYSASQVALLDAKLQGRGGLAGYEKDIEKITKALGRADEEGNKAYTALETLGVNAAKANDPLKVLGELTEKYGESVKTGNISIEEQAALQLALGNSWKEVIFRQQEAADALQMYNDFQERGIGISRSGEKATSDYNTAMDSLSYIFKVVGSQLVSIVMPAFTGLVGALSDSYKNGGLVKLAFDGLKIAANLVMIPIRALFNIFIQLDAAIQSVGTSLSTLFEAIRTRSFAPFEGLADRLKDIWTLANTRTVSMWGTDDGGIVEAPTKAGSRPRGAVAPPKEKKTKEKFDSGRFESSPLGTDWEDTWYDYMQAQEKVKRGYLDMIDPLNKYTRMLEEVRALRQLGMISAEQQLDMELDVESQREAALRKTINTMNEMSKVGEMVFQSVSQAFSNMVQGSKTSFKEMASGFMKSLLDMYIQAKIMIPMFTMLKSLTGWSWISIPGTASANGNVFGKSGLLQSANGNAFGGNGSVLTGPALHTYNGGVGVAGEAGPEAVLPLTRIGGKLGVQSTGGGGGGVVQHISIVQHIEGGKDANETGEAVSRKTIQAFRGLIKEELTEQERNKRYAV